MVLSDVLVEISFTRNWHRESSSSQVFGSTSISLRQNSAKFSRALYLANLPARSMSYSVFHSLLYVPHFHFCYIHLLWSFILWFVTFPPQPLFALEVAIPLVDLRLQSLLSFTAFLLLLPGTLYSINICIYIFNGTHDT